MITIFESYTIYKPGDFILLKIYKRKPWQIDRECKVISYLSDMLEIESYHHNLHKITKVFIFPHEIQRKLKRDEIEKLKIKLSAKKYNIL
jgi:hypothetical protein